MCWTQDTSWPTSDGCVDCGLQADALRSGAVGLASCDSSWHQWTLSCAFVSDADTCRILSMAPVGDAFRAFRAPADGGDHALPRPVGAVLPHHRLAGRLRRLHDRQQRPVQGLHLQAVGQSDCRRLMFAACLQVAALTLTLLHTACWRRGISRGAVSHTCCRACTCALTRSICASRSLEALLFQYVNMYPASAHCAADAALALIATCRPQLLHVARHPAAGQNGRREGQMHGDGMHGTCHSYGDGSVVHDGFRPAVLSRKGARRGGAPRDV